MNILCFFNLHTEEIKFYGDIPYFKCIKCKKKLERAYLTGGYY